MKHFINEEIDAYIRGIYAWTFDYEVISAWLIAIPIGLWIALGAFYILNKSLDWEGNSWREVFGKISIFIFTPIVYFIAVGYTGYYYFN